MEHSDLWPTASLAELLRGYRHAAELTQQELAARAGLSLGAVRDLEQGRRRPRPDSVTRLAEALGLEAAQARDLARAARADGRQASVPARPGTRGLAVTGLRLEVLGPLTAWRAGAAVVVAGPARRAVLGLLAVAGGSLVHRETIIDVLWPDDPPPSAVNVVQAHVSALRRVLDPGRGPSGRGGLLASAGASYELRAGPGQLDLLAFRQLTARARAARSDGDDEAACGLYQQALRLWRGEPLADVDLLRGHPAVISLARQRTETVIEYARTAAAAGWHDRVLAPLREVAGREPLNEQAHALLMVALAGSGQQAEALAVHHDLRRRLDEELGIPPGPEVAQAHQQVLRQDIPIPQPTKAVAAAEPAERSGRAAPEPVVSRQLPAAPPAAADRALPDRALPDRALPDRAPPDRALLGRPPAGAWRPVLIIRSRLSRRGAQILGAALAAAAGITLLAVLLSPSQHANQAVGDGSTPQASSNRPISQVPGGSPAIQASSSNSVTTGQTPVVFSGSARAIGATGMAYAAFNADGSLLATGDFDGTVDLWNPGTLQIVRTLPSNETKVSFFASLTFAPNGTLVLGGDSNAYILNLATGTATSIPQINDGIIGSLDFSPDGKVLAYSNGNVLLDDLASGTVTQFPFDPNYSAALGVAFSPNGADLAVSDLSGSVYIWNLKRKTVTASLPDPGSQGIDAVAYSPDGKFLAAGDESGNVYIWRLADDRTAYVIPQPPQAGGAALSVAFSPNGKTLASVDNDNTVYIWNIAGLRL